MSVPIRMWQVEFIGLTAEGRTVASTTVHAGPRSDFDARCNVDELVKALGPDHGGYVAKLRWQDVYANDGKLRPRDDKWIAGDEVDCWRGRDGGTTAA